MLLKLLLLLLLLLMVVHDWLCLLNHWLLENYWSRCRLPVHLLVCYEVRLKSTSRRMAVNLIGLYLVSLLRLVKLCVRVLVEDILVLIVVVKTGLGIVLVDSIRTLVHVASLGWYSGRLSNLRTHGWTKWRSCRGARG